MKSILVAVSALLLSSGVTLAADSVATEPSGFVWTGAYAGVVLGYGTGASKATADGGFDGSAPDDEARLSPNGVVGAAIAGMNWQSGALVYGLEGEVGYLGAKDDFWFPNGDDYFATTEYGLYGALAGRLGYAIDRTLITARAGLIVAKIDYGYGDIDGGVGGSADPDASVFGDKARAGLLVGAALEHAFAGDWVGRLDYSYANFGKHSQDDSFGGAYRISDDLHMIRVGLIKKF